MWVRIAVASSVLAALALTPLPARSQSRLPTYGSPRSLAGNVLAVDVSRGWRASAPVTGLAIAFLRSGETWTLTGSAGFDVAASDPGTSSGRTYPVVAFGVRRVVLGGRDRPVMVDVHASWGRELFDADLETFVPTADIPPRERFDLGTSASARVPGTDNVELWGALTLQLSEYKVDHLQGVSLPLFDVYGGAREEFGASVGASYEPQDGLRLSAGVERTTLPVPDPRLIPFEWRRELAYTVLTFRIERRL